MDGPSVPQVFQYGQPTPPLSRRPTVASPTPSQASPYQTALPMRSSAVHNIAEKSPRLKYELKLYEPGDQNRVVESPAPYPASPYPTQQPMQEPPVNSLAPGVFPSEMTADESDENQKSSLAKEKFEDKVPARTHPSARGTPGSRENTQSTEEITRAYSLESFSDAKRGSLTDADRDELEELRRERRERQRRDDEWQREQYERAMPQERDTSYSRRYGPVLPRHSGHMQVYDESDMNARYAPYRNLGRSHGLPGQNAQTGVVRPLNGHYYGDIEVSGSASVMRGNVQDSVRPIFPTKNHEFAGRLKIGENARLSDGDHTIESATAFWRLHQQSSRNI